ncbi:MAG TPA: hypothetical protein ENJ28_11400 [Gammaproteobacteria bacterium]|nr:hypothetical protein [Gammaproteobacteria bacterium]
MRNAGMILLLLFVATLFGCASDTNNNSTANNAVPNNYFDEKATLQGTIFDAITGNRITDASLKVTLVRGTTYQSATVRTGTQDFAGDYALTSIPLSINSQTIYRIAVTVDGYQDFEAAVSMDAVSAGTLDKNYNFLGNVYLFPLGATANDLKVNVTYGGEAVEGATVLLQARTVSNAITTDTSNLFVTAQNGFQGSMSATTDANGIATFAGTGLVLGGQYRIDVLPLTHEGIQLALGGGVNVNIGTSNIVQNITLADLVPGTSDGLYVVSASNTDANQVTSTGVLTLVFSRPVSFVDETAITATLTNNTTAAIDATNAPDSGVTGTLSADGLTLTLTPNYSANPVVYDGTNGGTADNGLVVTYSNVNVRLQQANDTGSIYSVFGTLVDETGNNPSGSVLVTPIF